MIVARANCPECRMPLYFDTQDGEWIPHNCHEPEEYIDKAKCFWLDPMEPQIQ